MENKNNFTGIIIPVIVAVILLTVLPIINSINGECSPCEECPIYNIGNMEVNPDFSSGDYNVDKGSYDYLDSVTIIKDDNLTPENIKKDVEIFGIVGTYEEDGGGGTYEYVLPVTGDYELHDYPDDLHLTILFGLKSLETTINGKSYYPTYDMRFINYNLSVPSKSRTTEDFYYIFWEDFTENTLTIQAPFNPIDFECLGIFYATKETDGFTTLTYTNELAYQQDKATSSSIANGIIFDLTRNGHLFNFTMQGEIDPLLKSPVTYFYLPKLGAHELFVEYYGD